MNDKRYTIQTACPQCGCSSVSHLTPEEIRERFGDVPNVEMDCQACMATYATEMKTACPEWDADCRLES